MISRTHMSRIFRGHQADLISCSTCANVMCLLGPRDHRPCPLSFASSLILCPLLVHRPCSTHNLKGLSKHRHLNLEG